MRKAQRYTESDVGPYPPVFRAKLNSHTQKSIHQECAYTFPVYFFPFSSYGSHCHSVHIAKYENIAQAGVPEHMRCENKSDKEKRRGKQSELYPEPS